MQYIYIWIGVFVALVLTINKSKKVKPSTGSSWLRKAGVAMVIAGMILSGANTAWGHPSKQARPTANHNIQCVAGAMGVAGAWMGTIGSIPVTAGIVTTGAVIASTGATAAWADACPEFARAAIRYMFPASIGVWEARTVGKWFLSHFNSSYNYQRTGKFCVVRPNQATQRCFLWKNLSRDRMHSAFRTWLSAYNIPSRLYMGKLNIVG